MTKPNRSAVYICNLALAKIGHEPFITSLGEDSKAGRLCDLLYPHAVESMLREHIWRFSITKRNVAADASAPEFDDGKLYTIPEDCVRLIGVGQEAVTSQRQWRREGDKIFYTGETPLQLVYSRYVDDPNDFDSLFTRALTYYLGMELSASLIRDNGVQQSMLQLYERTKNKAAFTGAAESQPEKIMSETVLDARA